MGEVWSEGRKDLVPSNGPVSHPDRRMGLTLTDMPHTSRPAQASTPPREPTERELLAAARHIAQQVLHQTMDTLLGKIIDELRGKKGG